MLAAVVLALVAANVGLAVWLRLRPALADRHDGEPARPRRRRRRAEPDPFDVLTVQVSLGRVAAQLRALEADPHAWAKGRRMMAAQAAYDALLADACRLAGVEVHDDESFVRSEPERFREELELTERGWSW